MVSIDATPRKSFDILALYKSDYYYYYYYWQMADLAVNEKNNTYLLNK